LGPFSAITVSLMSLSSLTRSLRRRSEGAASPTFGSLSLQVDSILQVL
jgi:hypothetical protein